MPTMTKNRTCNKSNKKSCNSSKSNSKTRMSACNTVHVPMDDPSYDIEVIRAALGSVLGPMGYNFRVRPQSNSDLGDYASISVAKKSN